VKFSSPNTQSTSIILLCPRTHPFHKLAIIQLVAFSLFELVAVLPQCLCSGSRYLPYWWPHSVRVVMLIVILSLREVVILFPLVRSWKFWIWLK